MANSYAWAVNSMTAYPEYAGQPDIVFQVSWVCSATDGVSNTAVYGSVDLTLNPEDTFIPYADLTLDQVLAWVFGVLGEEGKLKAEADCDAQISAMEAPETVTPPLPWNVPAPVVGE